MIAGLLLGFGGSSIDSISTSMRMKLENATVKAANLAIQESNCDGELGLHSTALILAHTFDLLSDGCKSDLEHHLILPIATRLAFSSKDGLHSGYLLSTMDADIVQVTTTKFDWPSTSGTFVQCERITNGPVLSGLGPLTRLMCLSIANVSNANILSAHIESLVSFTRSVLVQWQQNKLSEVDPAEEEEFLSEASLKHTLPVIWNFLRTAMFSVLILQRAVLSRVLEDLSLPPSLPIFAAVQSLRALQNLYFISSKRAGADFSAFRFVHSASLDVLSQHPPEVEAILQEFRPLTGSGISQHPMDRFHDLFYFNTVEQLAPVLSDSLAEKHLVGIAMPYLGFGKDARLSEIFEAAHSVMLAVFSVPTNEGILSRHIHHYMDTLLHAFPQALSPRQFRLAIRTLVHTTSPPSTVAVTEPLLPSTILELVRSRLASASTTILGPNTLESKSNNNRSLLSEQAAFELALIDSLPCLPVAQLGDWLPLAAESLAFVHDGVQLQICRDRFWEVMTNGEMDVDRASQCFAWWITQGGREMVLGLPPKVEGAADGFLKPSQL